MKVIVIWLFLLKLLKLVKDISSDLMSLTMKVKILLLGKLKLKEEWLSVLSRSLLLLVKLWPPILLLILVDILIQMVPSSSKFMLILLMSLVTKLKLTLQLNLSLDFSKKPMLLVYLILNLKVLMKPMLNLSKKNKKLTKWLKVQVINHSKKWWTEETSEKVLISMSKKWKMLINGKRNGISMLKTTSTLLCGS